MGHLEDQLKETALSFGFDVCQITRADEPWEAGSHLEAFVAAGHHGSMDWMETTLKRRTAPTAMWSEAKSALIVAMNYGPDHNPLETLEKPSVGNISVYARGADYHDALKKKLRQLARAFATQSGEDVKIFVGHRTPDGKTACNASRRGLARQAYQSRQPSIWVLAFFRGDADKRRPRPRYSEPRSLWRLPGLS